MSLNGTVGLSAARVRVVAGALALLYLAAACTERNPDYDEWAYCERGERRCFGDRLVLICQEGHTWPTPDAGTDGVLNCWDETVCSEGLCVPDEAAAARPCSTQADCDANRVCTILIRPDDPASLGTYCILSPNPSGRPSGVGCNAPEECLTGRCTRGVCYGACTETADCPSAAHECQLLNLTIDGVRIEGAVRGCVPP